MHNEADSHLSNAHVESVGKVEEYLGRASPYLVFVFRYFPYSNFSFTIFFPQRPAGSISFIFFKRQFFSSFPDTFKFLLFFPS